MIYSNFFKARIAFFHTMFLLSALLHYLLILLLDVDLGYFDYVTFASFFMLCCSIINTWLI